ncbi:MAG: SH3 domain-containing protein [Myxococcota bacterium]
MAVASLATSARADDVEVFARVVVDSTPLRSGPGPQFRRVGVALRGDTFEVLRRATTGYWFEVERPDGTRAWILGDAVYNHEVGELENARRWRVFAPPPLNDAHVEIAVTFGALSGGGLMTVRPTILVDPHFGVEITGAAAVNRAGQLLVGGVGGIINIFPNWPVVPYVAVGGGVAFSNPNSDTFLLEEGTIGHLYGGGGLRFGFRKRVTLRVDIRAYAFFEANRYVAREEYSGGVSVFF